MEAKAMQDEMERCEGAGRRERSSHRGRTAERAIADTRMTAAGVATVDARGRPWVGRAGGSGGAEPPPPPGGKEKNRFGGGGGGTARQRAPGWRGPGGR